MVERHGLPSGGSAAPAASSRSREALADEPRLVEERTLQHPHGVERRPPEAERHVRPLAASPPGLGVPRLPHPARERGSDHLLEKRRTPGAGVLPGQELVEAAQRACPAPATRPSRTRAR